MGTRADFYVGRGKQAERLGSIAWDGYPDGIDKELLGCKTEEDYRAQVTAYVTRREDGTVPENGWPWPWDDSGTTDYAYAFDSGKVYGSNFGREWFDPLLPQEDQEEDEAKTAEFPDMKDRAAVTFGKRSGLMVFQGGTILDPTP